MAKLDPIPSSVMPLVASGGLITVPWLRWLGQFTLRPGPIVDVPLAGSPATYQASESGTLIISGGTVSSVVLERLTTSARAAATSSSQTGITSGNVPMANTDRVTITYTVAPTVTFIPG